MMLLLMMMMMTMLTQTVIVLTVLVLAVLVLQLQGPRRPLSPSQRPKRQGQQEQEHTKARGPQEAACDRRGV